MPKISLSSFARFFGMGKQDKRTDTTEIEGTASAAGLGQKIGNQGVNEQLMAELRAKLAEKEPGEEQPEVPQQEGTQTEDAQREETSDRRDSIEALYKELKTSKRGGFHLPFVNSSLYNNVMQHLENILKDMNQGFSSDVRSNMKQFDNIQAEYQQLINACEAYTSRTPSTSRGQKRQKIVQNILEVAQRDMIGLSGISMEFASLSPEEQAGKNWAELVDRARVTKLSVENLFGTDRAKGGAASEVLRLTPGMVKIRKKDGTETPLSGTYFFKPEDEIDLEQKTYALQIVNDIMARYPGLSPEDKEILRDWSAKQVLDETAAVVFAEAPQGLSELGQLALETIKNRVPGIKTTYEEILTKSKIVSEGGKVNMTKRNVATSRMAALLGLENLVAQSYTAELFDEATGRKVRGNMMEQAKGVNPKEYGARRKENPNLEGKMPLIHNLVQRDALNLQVLDVLCGQVDRHMGNIMLQTDENFAISGIMGIDNDAAFGLNTDIVKRFDRRVFDSESGKLALPYMDKNLAQRIMVLEPDAVRFSLKGLITNPEIEAVVKRLNMMKEGIQKTEPERFLEDSQWNQQNTQEIFEQGWNIGSKVAEEKHQIVNAKLKRHFNGRSFSELSSAEKSEFAKMKNQELRNLMEWENNKVFDRENYFDLIMMNAMGRGDQNGETPQIELLDT